MIHAVFIPRVIKVLYWDNLEWGGVLWNAREPWPPPAPAAGWCLWTVEALAQEATPTNWLWGVEALQKAKEKPNVTMYCISMCSVSISRSQRLFVSFSRKIFFSLLIWLSAELYLLYSMYIYINTIYHIYWIHTVFLSQHTMSVHCKEII